MGGNGNRLLFSRFTCGRLIYVRLFLTIVQPLDQAAFPRDGMGVAFRPSRLASTGSAKLR